MYLPAQNASTPTRIEFESIVSIVVHVERISDPKALPRRFESNINPEMNVGSSKNPEHRRMRSLEGGDHHSLFAWHFLEEEAARPVTSLQIEVIFLSLGKIEIQRAHSHE